MLNASRYIIGISFIGYAILVMSGAIYAFYTDQVYLLNNPTKYVIVVILGIGLISFPRRGAKIRKLAIVMTIAPCLFLVTGVANDFSKRIELAEKIDSVLTLRMRYYEQEPYSNEQKDEIAKRIKNEKIEIDLLQTVANYFTGYDTCMCGKGWVLIDEDEKSVFSVKHASELYVNGYVCFRTKVEPTNYLEKKNT